MPAPEISVVLPVYNGERYIEAALRSVLDQDADFELIVSDDISKDRTLEIVRSFPDPRIRILANTQNKGIFGNLNRAITAANGSLVQVFSQDDLMMPGFLRAQAAALQGHRRAGLVYNMAIYIDAEDRTLDPGAADTTPELISPETYLWISSHYGALPPSISSIMFTRQAYDEVGGFDESYRVAGDLEFYNRLSERYGIVRNMVPLHQVRAHGEATSALHSSGLAYLREEIRLADWYRQRLVADDYARVIKFRAATRGRYHLSWIARTARHGRLGKALSALALMNSLYPLPWTLWGVAAAKIAGPPHPSLRPPPR